MCSCHNSFNQISSLKKRKEKKCEDEYKSQGVAMSLQEQTDSWDGWGTQLRPFKTKIIIITTLPQLFKQLK